jgi:di/tricarboxylate transporter
VGYDGLKVASAVWVQTVTDTVITKGILWGILISAVCALLAIYIFTGSLLVTLLSALTMGCINVLVVGLYHVVGWKLGAIEGISITVLIGLCVGSCMHFSEAFVASPLNYRRDKAKCDSPALSSASPQWPLRPLSKTLKTPKTSAPLADCQ